jgi:hypothetical protein
VELLQFRRLASGNIIPELRENVGDEIVTFIAGETIPGHIVPEDTPYLQVMSVKSVKSNQNSASI